MAMGAAQRQHGRRGQAGRGGDGLHPVRGGQVGGLAGGGERLVPSSGVDAGPVQRRQGGAAVAAHTGGAQPGEGFAKQPDRQFGLVEEPGRRAEPGVSVDGSAGHPVQAGDHFIPVAERVRSCSYPHPGLAGEAVWPVRGRRGRFLHAVEGVPHRVAAFRGSGLVGDGAGGPIACQAMPGSRADASCATEMSVASALGVLVRPDQRPADMQPGCRCATAGPRSPRAPGWPAPGPSPPARRPGPARRRPAAAAALIALTGAEFGGALEGTRGRGGAAAPLRLGGRLLEQRGHVLVGFQRGRRQVPGIAVGLIAERVRDLQVGRGALGERDCMVDGRPDEGVGELRPRLCPTLTRPAVSAGASAAAVSLDPAAAVISGLSATAAEQQRLPCRPGEGAVLSGDDGGEPVGGRQRLGWPIAARRPDRPR